MIGQVLGTILVKVLVPALALSEFANLHNRVVLKLLKTAPLINWDLNPPQVAEASSRGRVLKGQKIWNEGTIHGYIHVCRQGRVSTPLCMIVS
jgi:hypothetical protein